MRVLKKLAPLAGLLLTACQATIPGSGIETRIVDTSCAAFQPIHAHRTLDTQETRDQVKEHNSAWWALCGKGWPPLK